MFRNTLCHMHHPVISSFSSLLKEINLLDIYIYILYRSYIVFYFICKLRENETCWYNILKLNYWLPYAHIFPPSLPPSLFSTVFIYEYIFLYMYIYPHIILKKMYADWYVHACTCIYMTCLYVEYVYSGILLSV